MDPWVEPTSPFDVEDLAVAYRVIAERPYTLTRTQQREAEILRLEADYLNSSAEGAN